jgi:probable phosphoglycerate mutase
MTEVVLIRHGETDWNRELRFQGHVDVALNAVGLEQARRLGARLAGETAQALYTSDLQRAQQTAQPIEQQLGIARVADAQLREQSFGTVDGMRVDEIQREHPDAWAGWLRFDQDFCMPGGESMRQFHARVIDAIHRVAADHRGQRVIVVTHGGVLDMVYRTARGLGLGGPRQSEIPNAGLNRVAVEADKIEILAWADVQHLANLPPQPVYDQRKYVATDSSPKAA